MANGGYRRLPVVTGGYVRLCYGAQPRLGLDRFPVGRRHRRRRRRRRHGLVLLSHEPALLQQPVHHYPVRGHHVAPRPPKTVFVEHSLGYAQRFQHPPGVRFGVCDFHRAAFGRRLHRRISAPVTVHRVVVEPALVRGRLAKPVGLEHLVDPEPVVGRRVEHGPCGYHNNIIYSGGARTVFPKRFYSTL